MSVVHDIVEQVGGPVRAILDIGALGTAFAAYVGWLPAVSAALSIIWFVIQIYTWAEKRWFPRDGSNGSS